ncbi:MAG: hypothetical protein ABSH22_14925 [Tepidisphaeraceae bacterium]
MNLKPHDNATAWNVSLISRTTTTPRAVADGVGLAWHSHAQQVRAADVNLWALTHDP